MDDSFQQMQAMNSGKKQGDGPNFFSPLTMIDTTGLKEAQAACSMKPCHELNSL